MKKFYLLYPLMFGKLFAQTKDMKISDCLFLYDKKNKKFFWVFAANYLMLPDDKDLYFQIPFACDSAEVLIADVKSGRGNFVKCIKQEDLANYEQIEPAKIDIQGTTKIGNINIVSAYGEKEDVFEYEGMKLVLASFEILSICILKESDKQIELFNEHKKFI